MLLLPITLERRTGLQLVPQPCQAGAEVVGHPATCPRRGSAAPGRLMRRATLHADVGASAGMPEAEAIGLKEQSPLNGLGLLRVLRGNRSVPIITGDLFEDRDCRVIKMVSLLVPYILDDPV